MIRQSTIDQIFSAAAVEEVVGDRTRRVRAAGRDRWHRWRRLGRRRRVVNGDPGCDRSPS